MHEGKEDRVTLPSQLRGVLCEKGCDMELDHDVDGICGRDCTCPYPPEDVRCKPKRKIEPKQMTLGRK